MSTGTRDSAEEARLLRGLLDDAHRRIRELQFRLDQFSGDLLTLKLNDRRHSSAAHGQLKHERRNDRAHSEEEYRGPGRSTVSTWIK